MEKDNADKSINAADLPQSETFKRREIFQHKQTADTGKALIPEEEKETKDLATGQEENKTSKEEGLNEARSASNGGAFEGFEDQQNDV